MTILRLLAVSLIATTTLLNGCSTKESSTDETVTQETTATTTDSVPNDTLERSESIRANEFFEKSFNETVARSPEYLTFLGEKTDNDKWDNLSEEYQEENLNITKRQLETLKRSINYDALDETAKLSYRLFVMEAERNIENYEYRYYYYPLNQMSGMQSHIPSFLINYHRVDTKADLDAYIKRLEGVEPLFDQLIIKLKAQVVKGIIVPKFILPHVRNDSLNILKGAPFESSKNDSTLLADFKTKMEKLSLPDIEQKKYLEQANQALSNNVKKAYLGLLAYIDEVEPLTTNDAGVWKLPDGDKYYNLMLRNTTTTDLSAEKIHQTGLDEVARIQEEMRQIMKTVKYDGSLQEFFQFMREDKRFYNDNTPEGRAAYLKRAEDIINTMKGRLDELFITKPKADLVVKAVEAFREKSAGKAFYSRPAPDGSRPGIFYANLHNMNDMPTYELEALAYHEGIPGHHMQLAISTELEDIPKFRKHGSFTAYIEGWGLYSEYVGKHIGFYQDPYSDFGRLSMELWRACRLVVDTGIHSKRWTREQAIKYLDENTPAPHVASVKAIERYIVLPSQATAYKIGMLKIMQLRQQAEKTLGDQFDIREYHDLVLRGGPLPLNLLEEQINSWIKSKTVVGNQ